MNKLTPGSNMRWSSKFILPEMRAGLLEQRIANKKKARPVLDEQEIEMMNNTIRSAYIQKEPITLVMFDELEDCKVIGTIERIDTQLKQVKVNGDWFRMVDIISAY